MMVVTIRAFRLVFAVIPVIVLLRHELSRPGGGARARPRTRWPMPRPMPRS